MAGSMATIGTGHHDRNFSMATTVAVLHATTIALTPDARRNSQIA